MGIDNAKITGAIEVICAAVNAVYDDVVDFVFDEASKFLGLLWIVFSFPAFIAGHIFNVNGAAIILAIGVAMLVLNVVDCILAARCISEWVWIEEIWPYIFCRWTVFGIGFVLVGLS